MRKLGLLAMFVASLWACDGTETSDNRSGSGGSGGTDGAVEIPTSVDATCRAYCANEPEGMSCGRNGVAPDLVGGDTVQHCYENCLETYEQQASLVGTCEEEWIAILDCYVDLDCDDLFGDCDPAVQIYRECNPEEPFSLNFVYCDNPEAAAPSCALPGYAIGDDEALRAKLEGCTAAACHGGGAASATTWMLDLSGSVEAGLSALTHFADDSPYFLVDDVDPDCSQMLTDLTSKPVGAVRQPIGGSFWSTDEIECFRSYLHEMTN